MTSFSTQSKAIDTNIDVFPSRIFGDDAVSPAEGIVSPSSYTLCVARHLMSNYTSDSWLVERRRRLVSICFRGIEWLELNLLHR